MCLRKKKKIEKRKRETQQRGMLRNTRKILICGNFLNSRSIPIRYY